MLLIPEQIYDIKKAIVEITQNKAKHYEDMMKSKELTGFESTSISAQINNQSQNIYTSLIHKINILDSILNTAQIIDERNFENIDIGTYFYYKWSDENEIKSAYLVESLPITSIDAKFISIDSDFGKSVKGAKEGDIIKYKSKNNISTETIQIIKISKEKNDYIFNIRERQYQNRICKKVKKEIKELLKTNKERYNYLNLITESQIQLIQLDLYKLRNKYISSTDYNEKSKLKNMITNLEKKLTCLILNTPNDGTIGIGSIIDFSLNNGYYYSLELIGKAYTTEYPYQYVEYISSLGAALYGKKAGDIFTFFGKNSKKYTGKILNVYNKDYEEIDSPKTYKKLNS